MKQHGRWLPLVALLSALVAIGGWGASTASTTEAAVTSFSVNLTGANEVPPVSDGGSATASFQFDDQTGQLSYTLTISGVAPQDVTGAHIHLGGEGVNGPVLHPLTVSKSNSTTTGTVTLSLEEINDLKLGVLYVNVHSVENPGGFARAQIVISSDAAIRAAYTDAIDAWNQEDVDRFLSHWTDNGVMSLGFSSVDEAREQLAQFIAGNPLKITINSITVSGNTASANMTLAYTDYYQTNVDSWVLQDGKWLIDDEMQQATPIPAGVRSVDLKLQEYAFVFDKSAVADGNFAFSITNTGTMEHEIDLAKIPQDTTVADLQKYAAQAGPDTPPPPGVTDILDVGPFGPGTQTTLVFTHPLAPGHYALLCFMTDADGIPHAAKGMIADFTVGGTAASGSGTAASGSGSITPPNTGDAGLKAAVTSNASLLALGLFVTLTGLAGFGLSRRFSDL